MSQLPSNNVNLSGGLPFQNQGMTAGSSPFGGDLAGSYTSAYNNALAMNQQNYGNILAGYQQTAGNQLTNQLSISGGYSQLANQIPGNLAQGLVSAGQQYGQTSQGINQGYGQLAAGVQQTIQGITASQQQAIKDAFTQQQGQTQQQLTNAGLGNTTVVGNMQTGNLLQEQKAQVALANQQAQLSAGYQSQLGLAGLGQQQQAAQTILGQQNLQSQMPAQYQAQIGLSGLGYQANAAAQQTGQANQQLGFMNSVQAPYPNGNLYAQLQQYQGQQAALQQSQALSQSYLGLARQAAARQQAGGSAVPMYASPGAPPQQPNPFAYGGAVGGSPYIPQQYGQAQAPAPAGTQGLQGYPNPGGGQSYYPGGNYDQTVGGYGVTSPYNAVSGAVGNTLGDLYSQGYYGGTGYGQSGVQPEEQGYYGGTDYGQSGVQPEDLGLF